MTNVILFCEQYQLSKMLAGIGLQRILKENQFKIKKNEKGTGKRQKKFSEKFNFR